MQKPIPVALAIVVSKNRILLVERAKDHFIGYLALPGGKVKPYENIGQAAIREIEEESGIRTEYIQGLGIVSEEIKQGTLIIDKFLIHVCSLEPKNTQITVANAAWHDLKNISRIKKKIVPSDYEMIKRMMPKPGGYYDSTLEKHDDEYTLSKFEKLS